MNDKSLRDTMRVIMAQSPALRKEAEITGPDTARYLLGYGGVGAALGAGVGALTGDMKPIKIAQGAGVGGVGGLAVGALALAAKDKREDANKTARLARYDTPNLVERNIAGTAKASIAGGTAGAFNVGKLLNKVVPKGIRGSKLNLANYFTNNYSHARGAKAVVGRTAKGGVTAAILYMIGAGLLEGYDAYKATDLPDK